MSLHCPHCKLTPKSSGSARQIVRFGYFYRASDQSRHQRFLCRACRKTFSDASFDLCYNQKKRQLNQVLFRFLASGSSQRRLAMNLGINRKTVVRKFIFLGKTAQLYFQNFNESSNLVKSMEFDDLETFEHSKMKPLSVIMAVESKTRKILGFRVASMPAKGHLAQKSLKKYGKRKDERRVKRRKLFTEIKDLVDKTATIKSDQSPHYANDVKEFFPNCNHETFKGRRGCVVGLGELKEGGFDPIFSLNHTFAMLRANINRLFRKTWNTTKNPERLNLHLYIYMLYHNFVVLNNPT